MTSLLHHGKILIAATCVLVACAAAGAQPPGKAQWTREAVPGNDASILAEAVLMGTYSVGGRTGISQLKLACERHRRMCMDCGKMADTSVSSYAFSWIIPAVPDFYYEPLALGLGQQEDLATLQVGADAPTPRRSGEVVMADGKWQIRIEAKPKEIHTLAEAGSIGQKVTLVLHSYDDLGPPRITMKNTIPAASPALEAVVNACVESSYRGSDMNSCEERTGDELIEVKVCVAFTADNCSNPTPSKTGATWYLTSGSAKQSGSRFYRLRCGYKKIGADNVVSESTDSGLSSKLKECDETFEPLSVTCK